MRKTSVTVVLILATITATAQTKKKLAAPVIPDEKTAVAVAEAVLIPIYGEERVRKERPFKALLKGGVWTVRGTFNHPDAELSVGGVSTIKAPIAVGGVAIVELSKSNGCVEQISHTQ